MADGKMSKVDEIKAYEEEMRRIYGYDKETDDLMYFTDVGEMIIDTIEFYKNYEIFPVAPTMYKDVKIDKLIQMFEDENFCNLSKQEILGLCTEVSNRLSRQISSIPSVVVEYDGTDHGLMSTKLTSNTIEINFNSFNNEYLSKYHPAFTDKNVGLLYLYTIIHELYHTAQNYNFYKFLHDMPYEKDTLCSSFQDMLSGTYWWRLNDDEMRTLYRSDLIELNSNIFATNTLLKFIEKGYFNNPEKVEKIIKGDSAFIFDGYDRKSVGLAESKYEKNLKTLSRIKDAGDEFIIDGDPYFEKEEVDILKNIYSFVSGLDMKRYQQKMQDK